MDEKNKPSPITNTTAKSQTLEGAAGFLLEALTNQAAGKGPGEAITDMEARGQKEVCSQTSRLPAKWNHHHEEYDEAIRAFLEAGLQFGEAVADDPLWQEVELPEGWKIEATEHSMWNVVRDVLGRVRISFFYKAAFYDRDAFMSAQTRFDATYRDVDWEAEPENRRFQGVVTDGGSISQGGKIIWQSEEFRDSEDYRKLRTDLEWARGLSPEERSKICESTGSVLARKASIAWLDKRYPDWVKLYAYWDDAEETR